MKYNTKHNLNFERIINSIKEINKENKANNVFIKECLSLPLSAITRSSLQKCVFKDYSGEDKCAKCFLFEIATDKDCATLPCETGYFMYSKEKNKSKVEY